MEVEAVVVAVEVESLAVVHPETVASSEILVVDINHRKKGQLPKSFNGFSSQVSSVASAASFAHASPLRIARIRSKP